MRPLLPLFPLLLGVSLTSLAAQQPLPLDPGDRLRLTSPVHQGVFTLIELHADTLVLADSSSSARKVPFAAVRRIDVSRGLRPRSHGFLRGAGIGFLAGATIGAVGGYASGDDPDGFISLSAEENALLFGALFGAGGIVVGGIIGALAPGERWERVPLPERAAVGLDASGRVLVAVRVDL